MATQARATRIADLLEQGVRAHLAGKHAVASARYREVLAEDPTHAVASNNLGALLDAQGATAEAQQLLLQAVEHAPDYGEAWNNLGLLLARQGEHVRAVEAFSRATTLDPENAGWHNNHANELLELFRGREAVAAYDRAIAIDATQADFWSNRGLALRGVREPAAAIASLERALTLDPAHLNALNNLGTLYKEERRFAEAHRVFERAVALAPNDPVILGNRASVFEREMDHASVTLWAQRALAADPDYPEAFNLLANVAMEQGRLDECEAWYQEALRRDPRNRNTNWNLALVWLMRGDFQRGWAQFEWRKQLQSSVLDHDDYGPDEWTGEPLEGRVILVYAEQGVGDALQFVRYAAELKARGASRVIVEAPWPIVPLLAAASGVDEAVARGTVLPSFDVHCSLMSLPWLLGTTVESIPARVPYLGVEPRAVASQVSVVRGCKVGIVWAGNPAHARDALRSAPLARFAELAETEGVSAFSLQKGAGPEAELRTARASAITDLSASLGDFRDTAAAIQALDLVITVDTSVAHLAGALGKPTWVLLPHVPDFRWMLDREDSPWYPTMRLFRQQAPGDWNSVFERVQAALRNFATEPADAAHAADVITLPSVTRTPDGRSRFDVWAPLADLADARVFAEYEAELFGTGAHLASREFLREVLRHEDHFVELSPALGLVAMDVAVAPDAPERITVIDAGARGERVRAMAQHRARDVQISVASTTPDLAPGRRLVVHAVAGDAAWPEHWRRPDVIVLDGVTPDATPLISWGLGLGYHLMTLTWAGEVVLDPVTDPAREQSVVLLSPGEWSALTGETTSRPSIERTLGIDWELRGDTGWGLYGLNLALELLQEGSTQPAALAVAPMTVSPLILARLAGRTAAGATRLLTGDSARQATPHGLMLRALGANLAGHTDRRTTPAQRNVGVVFFEDTALDAEAKTRAAELDLIVAGSSWNAGVLQGAGIDHVVTVLQGVDPSLFHPAPRRGLFPGRFVVFSGGKIEYRKGQDLVVAAFREFVGRHPDALLVVAWHHAWPHLISDLDLAGHVTDRPGACNGVLQVTPWLEANGVPAHAVIDVGAQPNAFMAQVVREADVALFPNRCEGGTNLVAMECMASGVPTILSANTGHLDLVQLGGCLPLTTQTAVRPPRQHFRACEGWGESSVAEIVEALETLYTDHAARQGLAQAGAAAMAPLTWRAQTRRLLDALAPLW